MTQEWRTRETDPLKRIVAELNDLRRTLTSITNGILTNAGLVVAKGLLRVLQSMRVEGNLDVTGTLNTSGDTTLGGNVDVTGDTTLGGPTTISGDTDITGDLGILDGGFVKVMYPASLGGGEAVFFGRLVTGATGDYAGTGFLIQETDSERNIFEARTNETGDAHTVQLYDNDQNSIIGVYESTTRGLSRPSFSVAMPSSYWQTWGSTDSASWTTIAEGFGMLYHGGVFIPCRATSSDSGTAGQVRATLYSPDTSTQYQVGSDQSVGFSIDWRYFEGVVSSAIGIGQSYYVRLQARVTSGTGRIHGVALGATMQAP